MWILTAVVFMVGLGCLALLGVRPASGLVQLILLSLGYLATYLLLWTFGPVVDWFAAGPEHPGPFARVRQALSRPERPATVPALLLFLAPLACVALWMAVRFDPTLLFLAVVVSFAAAQAIRPFSVRRDLLRAVLALPTRFRREHLGPDWQPPPWPAGRNRGLHQATAPDQAPPMDVELPTEVGEPESAAGCSEPVEPDLQAGVDDGGHGRPLHPDLRASLDDEGSTA